MKILDLYLARSVLLGVFIALLIICAVDWLGDLFYQVGRMSVDDKFSSVLLLTVLDIPHKLFEFLPSSLLIGALFSLGQYAATSELVAVGAGGYSRFRVGIVSCIAGMIITVVLCVFIEVYVPVGEKFALSLQQENEENILLASDESYWVRDHKRFIRVGEAVSQDFLSDISIYSLGPQGEIEWVGVADAAIRESGQWSLKGLQSSWFSANEVTVKNSSDYPLSELFLSNFLQSVTSDPHKMSVQRLNEYIFYLEDNKLDASEYKVALFKKIGVPLTGLAMLLLALPLVFRPRQMGGAGQRLLIGIVIALLVYIFVEAITNGAVVYQVPPIVVAFLPATILLACSFLAFKFAR